jgi:hypothetical protein
VGALTVREAKAIKSFCREKGEYKISTSARPKEKGFQLNCLKALPVL